MSNELRWGGINGKSLCKTVISDIWMVFAVMVITYLGLGIVGKMKNTPSYTSEVVVAVYPFNQMYTLEASSSALETVMTVNEVFNSEMFRTGLDERLTEPADYSLYCRQIDKTFILMLSVSSSSPESTYQIVRAALDYYGEISPHLAGQCQLEILTEPDFPTSPSNQSRILKYRSLLTLFMGFAMAGFLGLMYVVRKTYKTSSAIRKYYPDVRFFKAGAVANSHRNEKKFVSVSNREEMKKTAVELLQMLRAKNCNSIFVTSAAPDEGKTEIVASLAREMAGLGKSVIVIETDCKDSAISEHLAGITDQNIELVFANSIIEQDDDPHLAEKAKIILDKVEELADIVFVEGCLWTGSGNELCWKKATGTSLAVCRQDKADFYSVDRMMTDLQNNENGFLGCVLYEF